MKKRMRLLGLIAVFASVLFSGVLFADDSKKIFLLSETFDDYGDSGELYRYYQMEGAVDETIPYAIPIPDVIYEKIKNEDDKLLAVKKELTAAYTYLRLEKKLAELNGVYLDAYPEATVAVSDELNPSFQKDLDIVNTYANEEIARIKTMSKEEQAKLFVSDEPEFYDYGKADEFYEANISNFDEMKKAAELYEQDLENQKKATENADVEKKDKETPYLLYLSIFLAIALVIGLTVLVFKKRRW